MLSLVVFLVSCGRQVAGACYTGWDYESDEVSDSISINGENTELQNR